MLLKLSSGPDLCDAPAGVWLHADPGGAAGGG